MDRQRPLFSATPMPVEVEETLRRQNPWWEGKPGRVLPSTRRHLVRQIRRRLDARLAPIVAVRGARQIGKTIAQLQVLEDLLGEGVPPANILRVQFDELPSLKRLHEPILRIVDWFESVVLRASLNEAAHRNERTYLFFDEIQNLRDWAPQLKSLVDASTTQVVVTGSSALRIELGRDSLSGRLSTIEAGVLSLTEIALLRGIELGAPFLPDNGLEPLGELEFWRELCASGRERAIARDETFLRFAELGGYPMMHLPGAHGWHELADQLNENVIKRVIQLDLRVGDRGRKRDESLLREVFRIACRYAGQAPNVSTFVEELRRSVGGTVSVQRVQHYLHFLAQTLLVRLIEPMEMRLKKRRGAPKICLADHALRASWLEERVPLDPAGIDALPDVAPIAGRLAESVLGAAFATIHGLDIAWLPERKKEAEIDFVLSVGDHRIPVEVKYQRTIDPKRDAAALRAFVDNELNRAPFGVLVTRQDEQADFGEKIVALPLSSVLLLR